MFDLFLLCYVSIFNMVSINRSRGLSFTLTMDYWIQIYWDYPPQFLYVMCDFFLFNILVFSILCCIILIILRSHLGGDKNEIVKKREERQVDAKRAALRNFFCMNTRHDIPENSQKNRKRFLQEWLTRNLDSCIFSKNSAISSCFVAAVFNTCHRHKNKSISPGLKFRTNHVNTTDNLPSSFFRGQVLQF